MNLFQSKQTPPDSGINLAGQAILSQITQVENLKVKTLQEADQTKYQSLKTKSELDLKATKQQYEKTLHDRN